MISSGTFMHARISALAGLMLVVLLHAVPFRRPAKFQRAWLMRRPSPTICGSPTISPRRKRPNIRTSPKPRFTKRCPTLILDTLNKTVDERALQEPTERTQRGSAGGRGTEQAHRDIAASLRIGSGGDYSKRSLMNAVPAVCRNCTCNQRDHGRAFVRGEAKC